MNRIQAIETKYRGYRFRSRLEARWAVFFDNIGLDWFYEPEGFVLEDGTWYLPDFYIPTLDSFIEVKGVVNDKDENKIEQLSNHKTVYLLKDIPDIAELKNGYCDHTRWINVYKNGGYYDEAYLFCLCENCGNIGIVFDGLSERLDCCETSGKKEYTADNDIFLKAYAKAKSARFEHGETPNCIHK